MSIRKKDTRYDDFTSALDFVIEQRVKDIHTALPAIVETYDATTRRVRVKPAIRIAMSDGTFREHAPIINVPVIFPCAGGYTMTMPLRANDAILLIFSMRGLAAFKKSFTEVNPTLTHILDKRDAIAIPGFGDLVITLSNTTGITLQTNDGERYITISDDEIQMRHAREAFVKINDEGIRIKGNLTVEGNVSSTEDVSDSVGSLKRFRDQYNKHKHLSTGALLPIYKDPAELS